MCEIVIRNILISLSDLKNQFFNSFRKKCLFKKLISQEQFCGNFHQLQTSARQSADIRYFSNAFILFCWGSYPQQLKNGRIIIFTTGYWLLFKAFIIGQVHLPLSHDREFLFEWGCVSWLISPRRRASSLLFYDWYFVLSFRFQIDKLTIDPECEGERPLDERFFNFLWND